jgi:ubiquinone/menaquinone biosynthesis C-methylase UbiE
MNVTDSKDQHAEDVRRTAIEHHDDVVPVFEEHYRTMERDRFANAFAYGRYKVDVLLTQRLKKKVEEVGAGESARRPTVLDVGCGTGIYLRRFLELGLEPSGVEPAPRMLDAARRANPGLRVEQGVATLLPFENASFDAATSIEVLRYLDPVDIERSISEMLRVLRRGGFFFVTLVNRFALDGFWILQRLRQMRKGVEYDRKTLTASSPRPPRSSACSRGSAQ